MRHADGSPRWIEVVLRNLTDDPAVDGVVVNYRDVTTRRELEDELRHQAFHDSLTGLANRALFMDRLQHAIARERGFSSPLAVLFIDIDDFKTVNDSLGHSEGDTLLSRRRAAPHRGAALLGHDRAHGWRRVRRACRGLARRRRAGRGGPAPDGRARRALRPRRQGPVRARQHRRHGPLLGR